MIWALQKETLLSLNELHPRKTLEKRSVQTQIKPQNKNMPEAGANRRPAFPAKSFTKAEKQKKTDQISHTQASPIPASTTESSNSPVKIVSQIQFSSSLHEWNDPNHRSGILIALLPSYSIDSNLLLRFSMSAQQDLSGLRQFELANSWASLAHQKIPLNPWLNASPSISLEIPSNDTSRRRESLIGSIKINSLFSSDLTRTFFKDLSLSYGLSYRRKFHEFKTASTGQINTRDLLSHTLVANYTFLKTLSFAVDFTFQSLWSYNDQIENQFGIGQRVSWQFLKNLSISFGHSNGGRTLRPDGIDSNLEIFNGESSTLYGGLSLVY